MVWEGSTEATERAMTAGASFFLQGNTPRRGEKVSGSCLVLPRSLSSPPSALQFSYLLMVVGQSEKQHKHQLHTWKLLVPCSRIS